MRQITKDRLARIDAKVIELQEEFRLQFAYEQKLDAENPTRKDFFAKAHGSKAVQLKVQQLLDQREQIINKELFGSMKQSRYNQGLEERKFNYHEAIQLQAEYVHQLTTLVMTDSENLLAIKQKRVQLGNQNRIVAIHKNSLEKWLLKEKTLHVLPEVKDETLTFQDKIDIQANEKAMDLDIDVEIKQAIDFNQKLKENGGRFKTADTPSAFELLSGGAKMEPLSSAEQERVMQKHLNVVIEDSAPLTQEEIDALNNQAVFED